MAQATIAEDLEPGALRDEMLKGFDPSQETHEEYLQRINLERPFNAAQGGSAGQLVQNTADGSRPGYGGEPALVETIAPNITEITYEGGSKSYKGLIARQGKSYTLSNKNLDVVKDFIEDKQKTEKSFEGTGRKQIPSTSAEDKIAQKYYGVDKFDDLSVDIRSGIRTKKINPENSNYYIKKTGADKVKNFIKKFKKKEGRLPSKTEVRTLLNKDNRILNNYIDEGFLKDVDFLSTEDANMIGRRKKVFSDVQKLSKDKQITLAFQRGKINNDTIKRIMKLVSVDEVLAHDRLAQLANAYMGVDKVPLVSPKFKKQAEDILINQIPTSKSNLKRFFGQQISSSVGEKRNVVDIAKDIQDDYLKKKGLSQIYDIDEPAGRTSSVRRGTKPYAYFSQVIFGNVNKTDKHTFDAVKATKEAKLQRAMTEGKGVKQALGSLNRSIIEYEEKLNQGVKRGGKKLRLFKASLKHPSKTIARFNELPASAQKGFIDNFITKGYSFHVPKDIKTISELNADIQNPKSDFFKKMISASDEVKKYLNEYDETKLFNKVKKLLPEDFRKLIKKLPLRIAQGNDITEKRFASADNIMTSGVQYVDDVDKNFVQKNPWTSGAGVAGATAATLAGSKVAPKDPLKKARQKIKSGLGKTFRTLGTRAAAVPWAAWTIADNLKKGENIADAVIDPWVGAELMFPNLFKENVAKITKKPWVRNLLKAGKYGRMFTPIGAGITAAGLGIDAYKIARDEYQKMQGMTEQEKSDYLADQYEDLGGVYGEGAADGGRIGRMGGGIAAIRKPHAIPPERQGLRSIMINGKKS